MKKFYFIYLFFVSKNPPKNLRTKKLVLSWLHMKNWVNPCQKTTVENNHFHKIDETPWFSSRTLKLLGKFPTTFSWTQRKRSILAFWGKRSTKSAVVIAIECCIIISRATASNCGGGNSLLVVERFLSHRVNTRTRHD